MRGPP